MVRPKYRKFDGGASRRLQIGVYRVRKSRTAVVDPVPVVNDKVDTVLVHPLKLTCRYVDLPFVVPAQNRLATTVFAYRTPGRLLNQRRRKPPAGIVVNADAGGLRFRAGRGYHECDR